MYKIPPRDLIALVAVISSAILIGLGHNGIISYVYTGIIASYLGAGAIKQWRIR